MDTLRNIGDKIRHIRKIRGWSQETLAFNANINPAFLGHLERGLKSPTVATLEKIANALGISLSELFMNVPSCDDEIEQKKLSLEKFSYITRDLSATEIERINTIVQEIIRLQSPND